jgi:hypothetical protein
VPLGRARIVDPYPVGVAMSREQSQQRLQGVDQLYNGAENFRTGPRAVEQMYAPLRFHIGPGRGANTPGGISGSVTTAGNEYEPKRETMMKGRRRARRGR